MTQMTEAEFREFEQEFEQQFPDMRRRYQEGYFPAAIEGLSACIANRLPLPTWLAEAVLGGMYVALEKGGHGDNRRKGGYAAQAEREELHHFRWEVAKKCLDERQLLPKLNYPATRHGAFERASDLLGGTFARGSAEAIEVSFNRVQREKRDHPA